MTSPPQTVAIVGATGPTGLHLARHLLAAGRRVTAVSRSRRRLEATYAGLGAEIAEADALEPEPLARAVAGADLVVDAIGLPPENMDDHPRTARGVVRAASRTGARCLLVSSYWAFLPHRGQLVDESHPRQGGHPWFRARREAEEVFLEGGGAVVHLPDFFGPHVHTSTVQMALEEARAGRPMPWIGGAGIEREIAYLPDAMKLVAAVADRGEAYGTDWALPGTDAVSAAGLARLAEAHLGREVPVRAAPGWLLLALSLFDPELRRVRPLIPHYARPVRYDATKLRDLLGELPRRVPMADAVATTLEWMAEQERAAADAQAEE